MKKKSKADPTRKSPPAEQEAGTRRDASEKTVVKGEGRGGKHVIYGPRGEVMRKGPGVPMSKADAVEKVLRDYEVAFRRLADR